VVAGRELRTIRADVDYATAGLTARFGWRTYEPRGFRIRLDATFQQIINDRGHTVPARIADSLPSLYGELRLGVRYVLFEGDMDLDLFMRARGWSAMR
jgi:hypothetical protein